MSVYNALVAGFVPAQNPMSTHPHHPYRVRSRRSVERIERVLPFGGRKGLA